MDYYIREIENNELLSSAAIVRMSFATVAEEFHLTKDNCPTNGAFIEAERLAREKEKGMKLFGLFKDNLQIGFVAAAKVDDYTYEMEKLSVLPQYRHCGYGKELINYVKVYVKALDGRLIKIGIIDENKTLKQWYLSCGFIEKETRKFSHLPFTVRFMELSV